MSSDKFCTPPNAVFHFENRHFLTHRPSKKHLKYGEKALQFVVIFVLERAFERLWVRLAQLVECMAVMVEVAVSNLSECRSP